MPLVLTSPGPSTYPLAIQVTEAAEAVPNRRLAARRSMSRLGSDFIDMAVLAHAQKNQVEHRLSGAVHRSDAANLRLRLRGRPLGRNLAAHAMYFVRRNRERVQQMRLGQPEIALGIGRRHAPLVSPEKMHVAKRNRPGWRVLRHCREELFGDASTG